MRRERVRVRVRVRVELGLVELKVGKVEVEMREMGEMG